MQTSERQTLTASEKLEVDQKPGTFRAEFEGIKRRYNARVEHRMASCAPGSEKRRRLEYSTREWFRTERAVLYRKYDLSPPPETPDSYSPGSDLVSSLEIFLHLS
jgi:hypothetical protein